MLENNHVKRKKRSFINHGIGSFLQVTLHAKGVKTM